MDITKIVDFIRILVYIIMFISILMTVYGGFKYVLSVGEEKAMNTAKLQIFYSSIGLFIAMTALMVTSFFGQINIASVVTNEIEIVVESKNVIHYDNNNGDYSHSVCQIVDRKTGKSFGYTLESKRWANIYCDSYNINSTHEFKYRDLNGYLEIIEND